MAKYGILAWLLLRLNEELFPQWREKYPTKAVLCRLWNPHEGCVRLMTGWSMSADFLYITLKAEWGTVLQRRRKYPTKAAISRLWNPHEGCVRLMTDWSMPTNFLYTTSEAEWGAVPQEGESIQQRPHTSKLRVESQRQKRMSDNLSPISVIIYYKCMNIWMHE